MIFGNLLWFLIELLWNRCGTNLRSGVLFLEGRERIVTFNIECSVVNKN